MEPAHKKIWFEIDHAFRICLIIQDCLALIGCILCIKFKSLIPDISPLFVQGICLPKTLIKEYKTGRENFEHEIETIQNYLITDPDAKLDSFRNKDSVVMHNGKSSTIYNSREYFYCAEEGFSSKMFATGYQPRDESHDNSITYHPPNSYKPGGTQMFSIKAKLNISGEESLDSKLDSL